MKKKIKILLKLLLTALLIWPVYYFITKKNAQEETYITKKLQKRDLKNFIICSGIILPKEEVEIKSRVSGVLEKIYVKNGDSIHKNQIIAKIKIIPDIERLSSSQIEINVAKNRFNNKKAIYNRNKELFEKGIVAKSKFEIIETDYLNALEDLKNTKRTYQIVKSGNYSGGTTNTSIVSTIDGVVTLLPIKVGSSVIQSNNFSEGTTIAKVANIDEMIFEGNVKEYEVAKLTKGMPVKIATAISDKEEDGILSEISTSGKNTDGLILFEIKSKLTNSKIRKTGFSANAKIIIKEKKNILCLKEKWITFSNDTSYVYIHKNDDKYEKRAIKLGISDGVYTEVISGIKENESIRIYDN